MRSFTVFLGILFLAEQGWTFLTRDRSFSRFAHNLVAFLYLVMEQRAESIWGEISLYILGDTAISHISPSFSLFDAHTTTTVAHFFSLCKKRETDSSEQTS